MVWHWNCASALCHNSWRTKGVRYYNLPVDPELRRKYQLVLKNENVNWTKQVICSAHWSRGERLSPDDIPDVICSKEQQKKFESLLKKAPSKSLKKKVAGVHRALVEANRETRGAPLRYLHCPQRLSSARTRVRNMSVPCARLRV